MAITIELYGIPRARAGRAELAVSATTASEALAAAVKLCPALAGICQPDGRLAPQFLLSLDGRRFLTNLGQVLEPGDRLLLLSMDAGG